MKGQGETMVKDYYVWIEITANMDTILSKERFQTAMERCRTAGIEAAILSVKDTTGFVLYPSSYAEHYSTYHEKFQEIDYLQQCIDIIHGLGMKVYAAFDVFTEGTKKNMDPRMKGLAKEGWMCELYGLNQENQTVVQKIADETPIRTGDSIDDFSEIFVNPANDEVVEYELHLMEEVMTNYEIDGIVLDRVRYVGLGADFSELTMRKWKQANDIPEEVALEDIYKLSEENGKLKIEFGSYFGSFNTFRAQMIAEFMEKVRNNVDQVGKKIDFIDYTGSWYPLYYMVGANWASKEHREDAYPATDPEAYAATGYIDRLDKLMSGFYYEEVTIQEAREHRRPKDWYSVEGSADMAYHVTQHRRPVIGSLFLHQYHERPENIRRAIEMCFRKSEGCMLFDLSYIIDNDWWKQVSEPLE